MTKHAPLPFGEELKRARQEQEDKEWLAFHGFHKEYLTSTVIDCDVIRLTKSNGKLGFLDPRTSELVLTSLDLNQKAFDVYLPVLMEDPSRHSAWSSSASIRSLAYSLLLGTGTCVNEHIRKGFRIAPEQIDVWNSHQVQESAIRVLDQIRWASTTFHDVKHSSMWKILCVARVIAWYLSFGRVLAPVDTVKNILEGSSDDIASDTALLWTRVQGYMYSLRILQQILSITTLKLPKVIMKSIEKLSLDIANLPQLRVL